MILYIHIIYNIFFNLSLFYHNSLNKSVFKNYMSCDDPIDYTDQITLVYKEIEASTKIPVFT